MPCNQHISLQSALHVHLQSSAALRVARGMGLERPDAVGVSNERCAVGSADMLRRGDCHKAEF